MSYSLVSYEVKVTLATATGVLQTIQMKLEWAILGSAKTALKFNDEI